MAEQWSVETQVQCRRAQHFPRDKLRHATRIPTQASQFALVDAVGLARLASAGRCPAEAGTGCLAPRLATPPPEALAYSCPAGRRDVYSCRRVIL